MPDVYIVDMSAASAKVKLPVCVKRKAKPVTPQVAIAAKRKLTKAACSQCGDTFEKEDLNKCDACGTGVCDHCIDDGSSCKSQIHEYGVVTPFCCESCVARMSESFCQLCDTYVCKMCQLDLGSLNTCRAFCCTRRVCHSCSFPCLVCDDPLCCRCVAATEVAGRVTPFCEKHRHGAASKQST